LVCLSHYNSTTMIPREAIALSEMVMSSFNLVFTLPAYIGHPKWLAAFSPDLLLPKLSQSETSRLFASIAGRQSNLHIVPDLLSGRSEFRRNLILCKSELSKHVAKRIWIWYGVQVKAEFQHTGNWWGATWLPEGYVIVQQYSSVTILSLRFTSSKEKFCSSFK